MATGFVSKAAVALKAWMEANHVSQAKFALRITEKLANAPGRSDRAPVNQSTVSSWTRGENAPSGLAMVAIQETTEGGVQVTDWLIAAPSESQAIITTPAA